MHSILLVYYYLNDVFVVSILLHLLIVFIANFELAASKAVYNGLEILNFGDWSGAECKDSETCSVLFQILDQLAVRVVASGSMRLVNYN